MDAELIKTHNGIGLIFITNNFFLNPFLFYYTFIYKRFYPDKILFYYLDRF